jgi:uncharacterized protein YeaO (DUF488 family)
MIYTSYFANYRKFPENYTPVSIAAKPPEEYKGLQYKVLAPPYKVFMEYKNDWDEEKYTKNYKEQVLDKLKQPIVVKELIELAQSNNIVLLCYEGKGKFCHRTLVMEWLREYGYDVNEL